MLQNTTGHKPATALNNPSEGVIGDNRQNYSIESQ